MRKADQYLRDKDKYLRRVSDCIKLAKRAKTEAQKEKLLQIAVAWRALVEESHSHTVVLADPPSKN